ncbi:hypothetical protein MVLG_06396 [Microbotryum lychnidis-dioicae p1A1 Lamole]|uniref:Aminotransferase class I/classII large domain-containing protein n=2 Tax=Microbotryum TaxID=34416 RepID=U5HH56_USTV1|nr:hypothetical protein MVLG_06396 [Microbotryum lychnidis-dioicae p1A1 Lamole]SGZ31839.1 BQ5605_C042g12017 [Microbotryum silenes-dioicae]|eukprot:KDE03099.1 hypothetical protein MVLG_06396 [Microbotryum lychnidis-dioicae p1A1 Lamole]
MPSTVVPQLSKRGVNALHRPPLLRCALFDCQYTSSDTSGLINMGVAENSLLTDWLLEYFHSNFKLEYSDFTYGTALGGSIRLFKALNHLFDKYFHARVPVSREHIVAGTGCGTVIDLLVSCLADDGDGILVALPHYSGFVSSFGCRNQVVAIGVELEQGQEADASSLERFEAEFVESEKNGVPIKAVMLCNPQNPLGFCYSRETILAYCRFAEKHNIHLIVDEIYALSTFSTPEYPDAVPFTSILAIDTLGEAGCSPARVHAVYGASKDWGANGLRIGALISQANPELHIAMESSCLLMKISSPADALWSSLLLDPVALPKYIEMNQSKLAEHYQVAVDWLKRHEIPFRPSNAAHFIWIDLRKWLPTQTSDGQAIEPGMAQEAELAARFAEQGVVLARGAAYGHSVAGYFRLTFCLRPEVSAIGRGRVERALGLQLTQREVKVKVSKEDMRALKEVEDALHDLDTQ